VKGSVEVQECFRRMQTCFHSRCWVGLSPASGGSFTDEPTAVDPPYSGKPGMLHTPSVQIGSEGAPT
jgi:hypothetical protein